ncbi:MAG: hypothetical protein JNM50_01385 [Chromatiales bacterium]|nr:hypothetical protein [Chromatiales bacterium]
MTNIILPSGFEQMPVTSWQVGPMKNRRTSSVSVPAAGRVRSVTGCLAAVVDKRRWEAKALAFAGRWMRCHRPVTIR